MKKTTQLFTLLAMLCLTFVGCQEPAGDITPQLKIVPAKESVDFPKEGGTETFKVVTTAGSWKVESNQDWCAVDYAENSSFTITAEANVGYVSLPEAMVTLTADDMTLNIKVNQSGRDASELTFELEVSNITASTASLAVTPSDEKQLYYYDIIPKALLDEHHNSSAKTLIEAALVEGAKTHGTMEEAIAVLGSRGNSSYDFSSLPTESEIVAFAAGITLEGKVIGEPATESFTTSKPLDNVEFNVVFSNYARDGVDFTVIPPSDDYSYYVTMREAYIYRNMTDQELLNQIVAEDSYMIYMGTKQGNYTWVNEHVWMTDTENYVLIFGVKDGQPVSNIQKVPFRTLTAEGEPEDCTFTIATSDITAISATVTVTPSDATMPYVWDVISKSGYEANKNRMDKYVKEYYAENYNEFSGLRVCGKNAESFFQTLSSGTEYYVWAVPTSDLGEPMADVTIIKPAFTTEEREVSTAEVSVVVKYFDGDDIYAMDNELYADAKGKAYVDIKYTANKDCKLWYGDLWADDAKDPSSNYSDDELSNMVKNGGKFCPTGILRYAEWDEPYILLGVGIAADENYGPLIREELVFKKANVLDISEFVKP